MARVLLEYTNLLEENKTLGEMMNWCDSVMNTQVRIIASMDGLLIIKEDQIENKAGQIQLQNEKYELAEGVIKKEIRLKWIFVGTTIIMAIFLTLSLL